MEAVMEAAPVSSKMLWIGRIVSAVPVLILLISALMKFAKPAGFAEGMEQLGWPENLATTLGVIEIICTILYVIPRTAVIGAILLTGYLGGAIATHARIGDPAFVSAAVLGILLWAGLHLRDARLRIMLARSNS